MTYLEETDVEAILGIPITSSSVPLTSENLAIVLGLIDGAINGYLGISTNATDTVMVNKCKAVEMRKIVNYYQILRDTQNTAPHERLNYDDINQLTSLTKDEESMLYTNTNTPKVGSITFFKK